MPALINHNPIQCHSVLSSPAVTPAYPTNISHQLLILCTFKLDLVSATNESDAVQRTGQMLYKFA